MPLSKEHKKVSREKILASAVKLFPHKGIDNVSIEDVMQHAGMTRGAFYAHFKSKEDLYSHAILKASELSEIVKMYFNGARGQDFVDKIIDGYLSQYHTSGKTSPCPLAFLATDAANNKTKIRSVYTEVFINFVNLIKNESTDSKKSDNKDLMMAVTAMMIGGVAVSRALVDSELKEELLASCRNVAHQLLPGES